MPSTRAERSELLGRLREEARIGEALRSVSDMLAGGLDAERVLQAVTDAATNLTGADYGVFFHNRVNAAGEQCQSYIFARTNRGTFDAVPVPVGNVLFCSPFAGEGVARIDDVTIDPRYAANSPYLGLPPGHPPVRSYLAVPLVDRDNTIEGGLLFGAAKPAVFGRREERYAVALGGQAVLALANARSYTAELEARLAAEESATHLAALHRIAARLAEARGLLAVANAVVGAAAEALAADGTMVALLGADADSLEVLAGTGLDQQLRSHRRPLAAQAGSPSGDALVSREPVLLTSVQERSRRYPNLGGDSGCAASWAVVPLIVKSESVGVLAFSWRQECALDPSTVTLMTAVALQSAQALDRARLDDAEQLARRGVELVADASRVLAATLDWEWALGSLAHLLVPQVADAMAVHRYDGHTLRPVALVHADPQQQELMRSAADATVELPPQEILMRVLTTREPLFLPRTTPTEGAAAAEGLGPVQVRSGICSVIIVPFLARGRGLGVFTLAMGPSGRHHTAGDLALVEEIARRSGESVDTALRYRRERDAALTLQRALLPARMPNPEFVTVAARYLPGTEGTTAGGDWYDVLELSTGRVGLVIGDVMGRGITAAAVMGQLRSALRAYATMDLPPAAVMARMDVVVADVASGLPEGQLVTCVYAVYEPVSGLLSYAVAGHPPPLLVLPGGAVTRLPLPSGVPLGVGGIPFDQHQIVLPPGSVVVLYTDGLVESRVRDVDSGVEELRGCLADAPAEPEELCDRSLLLAGDPRGQHDDVALLAVRLDRPTAGDLLIEELAGEAAAVPQARAAVRDQLAGWQVAPEVAEVCQLLVCELVTNAVRHGAGSDTGPVQLRLRRGRAALVVEVADCDPRLPRPLPQPATALKDTGRGLLMVDALATRWGARPQGDGKVVWCEVPL